MRLKLHLRAPSKSINVVASSYKKLKSLSDMKIRYIKNLSKNIVANQISLSSLSKLPDEKVKVLCEQDGIGRWTAEMFLIFTLRREDITRGRRLDWL